MMRRTKEHSQFLQSTETARTEKLLHLTQELQLGLARFWKELSELRVPNSLKLQLATAFLLAITTLVSVPRSTASAQAVPENPSSELQPETIHDRLLSETLFSYFQETGILDQPQVQSSGVNSITQPDIFLGQDVTEQEFRSYFSSVAAAYTRYFVKEYEGQQIGNRGFGLSVVYSDEEKMIGLTCAHCVDEGVDPADLVMSLGTLDRHSSEAEFRKVLYFEIVPGTDAAIIVLEGALPEGVTLGQIAETDVVVGDTVVPVGRGRIGSPSSPGGAETQSQVLQWIPDGMNVYDASCKVPAQQLFCAGNPDGEYEAEPQITQGDSGYPTFRLNPETDRYEIVGLNTATSLSVPISFFTKVASESELGQRVSEVIARLSEQSFPVPQIVMKRLVTRPLGGFVEDELGPIQVVITSIGGESVLNFQVAISQMLEQYLSDEAREMLRNRQIEISGLRFEVEPNFISISANQYPECATVNWDQRVPSAGTSWDVETTSRGEQSTVRFSDPEVLSQETSVVDAGQVSVSVNREACGTPPYVGEESLHELRFTRDANFDTQLAVILQSIDPDGSVEEFEKLASFTSAYTIFLRVTNPLEIPAEDITQERVLALAQPEGGTTTFPVQPLQHGSILAQRSGNFLVLTGEGLSVNTISLELPFGTTKKIIFDEETQQDGTVRYGGEARAALYSQIFRVDPKPTDMIAEGVEFIWFDERLTSEIFYKRVGNDLHVWTDDNLVLSETIPYFEIVLASGSIAIPASYSQNDAKDVYVSIDAVIEDYFSDGTSLFLPLIMR